MKRWIVYMCVGVITLTVACFPTKDDVNDLQEANQVFIAGLHDAGNDLMTKQHQEMTPAVAEALALMNSQYLVVSAELKSVASEVKAKGVDVGMFGGDSLWGIITVMFPGLAGIGLWIRNLLQPSRAASQVSALEASAAVTAKELSDLKMSLAEAAGTGDVIPAGGTA